MPKFTIERCLSNTFINYFSSNKKKQRNADQLSNSIYNASIDILKKKRITFLKSDNDCYVSCKFTQSNSKNYKAAINLCMQLIVTDFINDLLDNVYNNAKTNSSYSSIEIFSNEFSIYNPIPFNYEPSIASFDTITARTFSYWRYHNYNNTILTIDGPKKKRLWFSTKLLLTPAFILCDNYESFFSIIRFIGRDECKVIVNDNHLAKTVPDDTLKLLDTNLLKTEVKYYSNSNDFKYEWNCIIDGR